MEKITFGSSYAKLSNAKLIGYTFKQVLKSPNSALIKSSWERAQGYSCGISLAAKDDPEAWELLIQPAGKIPPSHGISGLIGDYVHNLRTSLDAAIEAVRLATNTHKTSGKFPFAENDNDLSDKKLQTLAASLPDIDWMDYFKNEIRPFKEGEALLWTLNKLDNIVKHDSVIPHLSLSRVELSTTLRARGGMIKDCVISQDIDRINCAARIVPLDVRDLTPPIRVKIECAFPEDFAFFPGEPVLDILLKMHNKVGLTIKNFERKCLEAGIPEHVKDWKV